MTRKEQILQAARNYVSGVTLSSPSDVIHFEYGARWADEHPVNVWHDTNEEPKGDYFILCDGLDNLQWAVCYQHIDMSYVNWQDYVNAFKVNRWAYISDLLPKGEEKGWKC